MSTADRLRGFEALTAKSSIVKKAGLVVPQDTVRRVLGHHPCLQVDIWKKQQVKHNVTGFGDCMVPCRVDGNGEIGLGEVRVQIVVHMQFNKYFFR